MSSINLKFPVRKSSAGSFETNKTTIDAVTDNLKILVLTNYGERPIHFDFGANLRELIFEQGPDIGERIKDRVIAAVEKWMPYVTLLNITVGQYPSDATVAPNQIKLKIKFSVNQEEAVLTQVIAA